MLNLRREPPEIFSSADSQFYHSAETDTTPPPTQRPRLRGKQKNLIDVGKSVVAALQNQAALHSDRIYNPVSRFPEQGQRGAYSATRPARKGKPKKKVVVVPIPVPKPNKPIDIATLSSGKNVESVEITRQPTTESPGTAIVTTNTPVARGVHQITQTSVAIPAITGPHVMSKAGRLAMSSVMNKSGKKAMSSVSAPTSRGVRVKNSNRPRMQSSSQGIVIHHKEFLGSVVTNASPNTFTCDTYILNPGKSATFPWLSTMAGNFEKYRIRKCAVSFVSNQPTTVAGRVGLGIDYDSTDPLPADRQEFFSLTHHKECSVWDSITFDIPIQGGVRFVNSHTVTDSKLIDAGQILIFSDQYGTASTNVGDLIIEYIVELIDPQQAVYSTMSITGNNATDVASLIINGPVIATRVATTSTTVMELTFGIGYYYISTWVHDTTLNTPTCTPAIKSGYGTGTTGGVGDSGNQFRDCNIAITKQNATVRFTFSESVALMEDVNITITRISATVSKLPSFAQTTSIGSY